MRTKPPPACQECACWNRLGDTQVGECRRHAPRPYPTEDDTDETEFANWPITYLDAWCGEYQAKIHFDES